MNQGDIDHLLPRYREGLAMEGECRRVEAWVRESEGSQKMADQMNIPYLAIGTVNITRRVDTKRALDKVRSRTVVRKTAWWEWIQRTAAVLFIPLFIAFVVQYTNNSKPVLSQIFETKTNPGMTASVVLSDNTVVYLNSESSLRYPTFFEGDTRGAELRGEIYFVVAKDLEKKFFVSTPHVLKTEVSDAHFNVKTYEDEPSVLTTLVEGHVCFHFNDRGYWAKEVVMRPRQKLAYSSTNGDVRLYATFGLSETAWKDGRIISSNTPLEVALRMLEERFNVIFIIKNTRLKTGTFMGIFTEQRLERILGCFKASSKIWWRYLESPDIQGERGRIEIY